MIDVLRRIASTIGATPAQLALAWLLAQKPWIVPIPGTRHIDRLDENLGAAGIQFTPEQLIEIQQALDAIEIIGDRYPKSLLETTGK